GLCTVEQLASAIGDATGEQAGVLASNNETKLMTDDEDDDNDLGSNKNKSFMSFHDEKAQIQLSVQSPAAMKKLVNLKLLSQAQIQLSVQSPAAMKKLVNLKLLSQAQIQLSVQSPAAMKKLVNLKLLSQAQIQLSVQGPAAMKKLVNLKLLSQAQIQLSVQSPAAMKKLVNLKLLCQAWVQLNVQSPAATKKLKLLSQKWPPEKQADENANEDLDLGVGADLELLKKVSTVPGHMLKRASHNHTVMFDISKLSNVDFTERPLPPYNKSWQRRMDADDYVRLAYHTNRWSEIKKNLLSLCSANVTYYHLEEVIMLCGSLDRDINQFDVLRHFFTQEMEPAEADHLLKNLLPRIVNLAVSLPDLIKAPIPLLKHRKVMKLSLSQQQIASLLANAFFCTFPQQGGPYSRFPSINFHSLYSSGGHQSPCGRRLEKLRCIFNYFNRITKKEPNGVVTISRRCLKQNLDWCSRVEPIPKLLHVSSIGTIEDTDGEFLEADFANKYIGGGVLGHGFVQEEIRFSICPELIVTRLVAECMDDREALHVKGFERFSNYTGYANSCQWDGDHQDARSIGLDRRRRSHLVAMDALKFSNWREQFCRNNINRELHKALVAFGDVPRNQRSAIATGNWGCGAFKGDVRLKFLIQLMACAVAGRSMAYFTFGDKTLQQRLLKMHRFLTDKEVCVGGVYSAVIAFTEHLDSSCHGGWQYNSDSAPDLFEFLRNYVLHGPTVPPPTEPSISKKDIRIASKRANANKKMQERQQNSSDVQESKPNNEPSDQSGQAQVANAESEKQATAADLSDANSGAQAQETRSSDGEWKQQKRKNKPNKSGLKSSQKSKSATEEQLSSKMSNMSLSSTTPQTNRGENRRKRCSESSRSAGAGLGATPRGCAEQLPEPSGENRRKRCSESSRSAGAGLGATPRGCAEQLPEPSKKKLRKDKRKKQNKNKKSAARPAQAAASRRPPPNACWSGDALDSLPKQKVAATTPELRHVIEEFRSNWTLFNANMLEDPNSAGKLLLRFVKPCQTMEARKANLNRLRSNVTYEDIELAIYSFGNLDHFHRPKLDVLHHLLNNHWPREKVERFYRDILPGMIRLALSLPELLPEQIPLLSRGRQAGCRPLSFTQQQVACLLTHAFFALSCYQGGQYPSINFNGIFVSGEYQRPCTRRIEKLKCILHYMDRVVTDGGGFLEVDFANKFLGGGALGHGLVQEEIRFMISPELIVTRLVTECLDDNEALLIEGFERFSDYSGYADSFRWISNHKDSRPVGVDRRRLSQLVAMDAVCFRSWIEQFSVYNIERELHKALVAFGDVKDNKSGAQQHGAVATGNWGCGAFKGDVRLKFLIQLMACSLARRPVAYFTFGDQPLQQRLVEMHQFLINNNVTVGGVYNALLAYVAELNAGSHRARRQEMTAQSAPDLFRFVLNYVQSTRGPSFYDPAANSNVPYPSTNGKHPERIAETDQSGERQNWQQSTETSGQQRTDPGENIGRRRFENRVDQIQAIEDQQRGKMPIWFQVIRILQPG
uniref:poly(ADP-ribose) glycohydrolase n=1 Tax=Macrostomum lignano TaxID=282301 RepID=A0A1I8GI98_9PLAT